MESPLLASDHPSVSEELSSSRQTLRSMVRAAKNNPVVSGFPPCCWPHCMPPSDHKRSNGCLPPRVLLVKLDTPARTSRTILKRYGESGQPCLVPDFRGITLSLSPFNLMLAVGLLYVAFIMLSLFIWWITLMDFRMLNQLCIPGMKPT